MLSKTPMVVDALKASALAPRTELLGTAKAGVH